MLAYFTTFSSLIFQNKCLTSVFVVDITDIKFQLHSLYFKWYSIQQQKRNNFQHFCYHLCVDTSYVIYNCCEYNNSQHSMLSHPGNKNFIINVYYQETFPIFMLAVWLFIIGTWNIAYLKVISNIQCYLCIGTIISSYEWNANKYPRFWFSGYSWFLNYMNFSIHFFTA